MSRAILLFMAVLCFLTLGQNIIGTLMPMETDVLSVSGHPSFFAQLNDVISSPSFRMLLVVGLASAGFLYLFGFVSLGGQQEVRAPLKPIRSTPRLVLSPGAYSAALKVRTVLAQLRDMPPGVVTSETLVEYEAIRDRHYPELEAAHRRARSAVPSDGPEAAGLDTDYASALAVLSAKLDELVRSCGREARADFATHRLFVETRHPVEVADGLTLASLASTETASIPSSTDGASDSSCSGSADGGSSSCD